MSDSQRALGAPPTIHACNCVGAQPGERLCPCMKNQQARQELEWRREHERKLDAIPAVSPDNDYEDTLARFSGLDVTLPYPGYEGRPVVEDFPLPAPAPRANHLITLTAFLFGLGVGTVASALLG